MGEGTQEQTQGKGINLLSKWLAGLGGVRCADKLDNSKGGGGLGVTAPTPRQQILITLSGSLEGLPWGTPGGSPLGVSRVAGTNARLPSAPR